MSRFTNAYENARCAEAYSKLEFPGTYFLAYRDLPEVIVRHVPGRRAVDFGCGSGRSTRFLRKLGFDAVGIDISEEMIRKARQIDPAGDYRLIDSGDLSQFEEGSIDLVLSAFTFDNIPTREQKVDLFKRLGRLLRANGRIVSLVSAPEIYTHEWASFSTKDYPENRYAEPGDKVRIIITASEDRRPVEDIVWPDSSYREVYRQAGLDLIETHKPLAKNTEPFAWVSETTVAPWVIYVLDRLDAGTRSE